MANDNPQKIDPQLVQVLELLGKFGFKFFGYSENKEPLVIAENGQIVTISVAYNFVQTQISKASAAASMGNIENMPQMPQMPSPETKVESGAEQSAEKQDSKTNFGLENLPKIENKPTDNKTSSTQQASVPIFGDGFKISSFDPRQIAQTIDFVKRNSKVSQTSPKRYLAIQLEKFLAELRMSKQQQ